MQKTSIFRVEEHQLYSKYLCHTKKIEIFLPPDYQTDGEACNLLIMNDGQDAVSLKIGETALQLHQNNKIQRTVVAAVHANNRLHEYGTARRPDYKNRGSKADAYMKFVVKELIPFLRKNYALKSDFDANALAGCSLGGLSAFDIVWHNPRIFGKTGVFSGALWWRKHSKNNEQANIERILHAVVRQSDKRDGLKFWFEAGTDDEKEDRNNNGIIDAIEDTLDLIAELVMKGYHPANDIRYLEVQGGQHNQHTWAAVLPDFLQWAFGKN